MDNLFEQLTQITKASACEILREQQIILLSENAELKIKLKGSEERIQALKDFINDVRPSNAISAEMSYPEPSDDLTGLSLFQSTLERMPDVASEIEKELLD